MTLLRKFSTRVISTRHLVGKRPCTLPREKSRRRRLWSLSTVIRRRRATVVRTIICVGRRRRARWKYMWMGHQRRLARA